jgi:hypothetical protein
VSIVRVHILATYHVAVLSAPARRL